MGVEVASVSPTVIVVVWSPLLERDWNGLIWYSVEFRQTSSDTAEYSNVTDGHRVTIGGLLIFTEYSVHVRAATSVGSGPYSEIVIVTILEDGRWSTRFYRFSSWCLFL